MQLRMTSQNSDLSGAPRESSQTMRRTPLEIRYAKWEGRLSASRKKMLGMILENPGDTFFLSSRELAKRYDVDAATIVRTIQALGYGKFAEFAADLRSHFIMRITPYTALKAASQERRSLSDRIRHGAEMDLRNLQALRTGLDPERIIALSKIVKRARRIMVVGIDLAASLSWHLAYGLMHLGFPAEAPVGGTGNVQRRVRTLTSKDLVIAISFGQCLRETVEAALRAKKQGVPTFGNYRQRADAHCEGMRQFLPRFRCRPLVWQHLRGADVHIGRDSNCLRAYANVADPCVVEEKRGRRQRRSSLVLGAGEWKGFGLGARFLTATPLRIDNGFSATPGLRERVSA